MDDVSAELSVYLRRLNRLLDCPKPLRKSFLKQTKRIAEDFIRGKPDAVPQEITDYLGDPQELAQGFLETLEPDVLNRYRIRKKFFLRGCITLLAIVLACVSIWCVQLLNEPNMVEVTETVVIRSN